jgi:hypothetical protein
MKTGDLPFQDPAEKIPNLSEFASAEFNVHDWRRCLVEGDFKII